LETAINVAAVAFLVSPMPRAILGWVHSAWLVLIRLERAHPEGTQITYDPDPFATERPFLFDDLWSDR
jgi:hypothetical protein